MLLADVKIFTIVFENKNNLADKLNKSLSSSTLWDKPKNKIIPAIMEENFKTLGINYAK